MVSGSDNARTGRDAECKSYLKMIQQKWKPAMLKATLSKIAVQQRLGTLDPSTGLRTLFSNERLKTKKR